MSSIQTLMLQRNVDFIVPQREPVNNKILSEARVFPAGDKDAAKCWKPWNQGLYEPFVRMMGLDE